jgi:ADP-ribose pyrophosphatase YjhB (NUDIX family)
MLRSWIAPADGAVLMTPRKKNAHCSYCGQVFAESQFWPRLCGSCGSTSYLNPLPVAVALLPVDGGILCVRRTIEPGRGKLALPGGFLEVGETWQEGCARELREETGVAIDPGEVGLFRAYSVPGEGLLLLFGLARARRAAELPAFLANEEVSEMLVLPGPAELAFPLHTRVLGEFFAQRG